MWEFVDCRRYAEQRNGRSERLVKRARETVTPADTPSYSNLVKGDLQNMFREGI